MQGREPDPQFRVAGSDYEPQGGRGSSPSVASNPSQIVSVQGGTAAIRVQLRSKEYTVGRSLLLIVIVVLQFCVYVGVLSGWGLEEESGGGRTSSLMGWIGIQVVWLTVTLYLSAKGFFVSLAWLSILFLSALFFFALNIIYCLFVPPFTEVVGRVVSGVPVSVFFAIHLLRMAFIFDLKKYRRGLYPLQYILLSSVPDAVFGFSCLVFLVLCLLFGPWWIPPSVQILIHGIGVSVHLSAFLSLTMGSSPVVGCFFKLDDKGRAVKPNTRVFYKFPFCAAPLYCFPSFWLAHSAAIIKAVFVL
uniref:Uncharacterized protein n=1 Tax=Chromera velia CCMP2878 TaxID=1169474 RepID=A0A0G4HZ65_9ALVE|eukprot:Cvel_9630.t1-p1 / transcript=Cvel_9630.t1 / gene=Cvel_9630 / organism=Chromera_velia_CCMP2878 / gene_product=hypothetical protein / transcript_product=hypothetical protein / location=Cvel_scaffold560:7885-9022(+) / protein_length=302 / sequence_SO=supercontig / SO=protein_coding / is_pseudo=false